jgi:hypothetical protein
MNRMTPVRRVETDLKPLPEPVKPEVKKVRSENLSIVHVSRSLSNASSGGLQVSPEFWQAQTGIVRTPVRSLQPRGLRKSAPARHGNLPTLIF